MDFSDLGFTQEDVAGFKAHFERLDHDGDGHISIMDLRTVFKASKLKMSASNLYNLVREIDTNRNGKIEFDEFVQMQYKVKQGVRTHWKKVLEKTQPKATTPHTLAQRFGRSASQFFGLEDVEDTAVLEQWQATSFFERRDVARPIENIDRLENRLYNATIRRLPRFAFTAEDEAGPSNGPPIRDLEAAAIMGGGDESDSSFEFYSEHSGDEQTVQGFRSRANSATSQNSAIGAGVGGGGSSAAALQPGGELGRQRLGSENTRPIRLAIPEDHSAIELPVIIAQDSRLSVEPYQPQHRRASSNPVNPIVSPRRSSFDAGRPSYDSGAPPAYTPTPTGENERLRRSDDRRRRERRERRHRNPQGRQRPTDAPSRSTQSVTLSDPANRKYEGLRQHPVWMIFILTAIQGLVLAYALIVNRGIEKMNINPMAGPSTTVLVQFGSKYSACMRPPTEVEIEYFQIVNGTFPCEMIGLTPGTCDYVASMEQFCGLGGFIGSQQPNQWYRIITASFIPSGIIHFIAVAAIQLYIGIRLEKLIGWLRMLFIFIIPSIVGYQWGAALSPLQMTNGTSPAVYGFFGVLYLDMIQNWRVLSSPKRDCAFLTTIIVLALLIGLLPMIDNFAHIGGLISGMLSALIFMPTITFGKWTGRRKRIILMVSIPVLFFIMFGVTYAFYKENATPCKYCQYLNCVPVGSAWCEGQF